MRWITLIGITSGARRWKIRSLRRRSRKKKKKKKQQRNGNELAIDSTTGDFDLGGHHHFLFFFFFFFNFDLFIYFSSRFLSLNFPLLLFHFWYFSLICHSLEEEEEGETSDTGAIEISETFITILIFSIFLHLFFYVAMLKDNVIINFISEWTRWIQLVTISVLLLIHLKIA